ncbi:hypothetical protein H9Q10_05530 [Eikenella sp. S3360]|uniref:2TM domain-containing protein n=1 Tax=Eikenella glucosivorans TaxID=2766967 RepID=A0ABS0N9Z8_9NEIS|nr:hypothetical protein [Eikenella glucosivorans]MBH5329127.1 hypothetical protein [Eikenella glucosivorans]
MKITSKDGKFFVFDATESLLVNILRNLFTLSILAFCIYISRGSTWWTFVSGLMFIVGIFSWLFGQLKRVLTFNSWDEFRAWVEQQEKSRHE